MIIRNNLIDSNRTWNNKEKEEEEEKRENKITVHNTIKSAILLQSYRVRVTCNCVNRATQKNPNEIADKCHKYFLFYFSLTAGTWMDEKWKTKTNYRTNWKWLLSGSVAGCCWSLQLALQRITSKFTHSLAQHCHWTLKFMKNTIEVVHLFLTLHFIHLSVRHICISIDFYSIHWVSVYERYEAIVIRIYMTWNWRNSIKFSLNFVYFSFAAPFTM